VSKSTNEKGRPPSAQDPKALEQISEALAELSHGRLTVVVQDGRIIQLERTEKVRLPPQPRP
jgi:hypothetical protein